MPRWSPIEAGAPAQVGDDGMVPIEGATAIDELIVQGKPVGLGKAAAGAGRADGFGPHNGVEIPRFGAVISGYEILFRKPEKPHLVRQTSLFWRPRSGFT
jgi:hypothetical protein